MVIRVIMKIARNLIMSAYATPEPSIGKLRWRVALVIRYNIEVITRQ